MTYSYPYVRRRKHIPGDGNPWRFRYELFEGVYRPIVRRVKAGDLIRYGGENYLVLNVYHMSQTITIQYRDGDSITIRFNQYEFIFSDTRKHVNY